MGFGNYLYFLNTLFIFEVFQANFPSKFSKQIFQANFSNQFVEQTIWVKKRLAPNQNI